MQIRKIIFFIIPFLLLSCSNFGPQENMSIPTNGDFKVIRQNSVFEKKDNPHVIEIITYSSYPFLEEFEFISFNENSNAQIISVNENIENSKQYKIVDISSNPAYVRRFYINVNSFSEPITTAVFSRNNKEIIRPIGSIKTMQYSGEVWNGTSYDEVRPLFIAVTGVASRSRDKKLGLLCQKEIDGIGSLRINDVNIPYKIPNELLKLEVDKWYYFDIDIPNELIDFETNYGRFLLEFNYKFDGKFYSFQTRYDYNVRVEYLYIFDGSFYS